MIELKRDCRDPLHEQIRNALRQQIRGGVLLAGEALPNERQLASELNISRMTIRRAYVDLTKEGLLERVCGRGTFVRRSVRASATWIKGSVCVVSTLQYTPHHLYYYRLLQGLSVSSEQTGFSLSFRQIRNNPDEFMKKVQQERKIRAIIAVWLPESYSMALSRLKIPVVLLESIQPKSQTLFDEATHDPEPGIYKAVSRLLELGHRRIAHFRSAINSMTEPRRVAVEKAFVSHQASIDTSLNYSGVFTAEQAYQLTLRVLANPNRAPTAILCAADILACGVFAAAKRLRLRIPEDLSVVGFGDEGYYFRPRLSTIRVPIEAMSAAAMTLLLNRLKNPQSVLQRIALRSEYVPRQTCAKIAR
jgi:GntR family transcriptional regulator, arabinose operon transcriptional repressor